MQVILSYISWIKLMTALEVVHADELITFSIWLFCYQCLRPLKKCLWIAAIVSLLSLYFCVDLTCVPLSIKMRFIYKLPHCSQLAEFHYFWLANMWHFPLNPNIRNHFDHSFQFHLFLNIFSCVKQSTNYASRSYRSVFRRLSQTPYCGVFLFFRTQSLLVNTFN